MDIRLESTEKVEFIAKNCLRTTAEFEPHMSPWYLPIEALKSKNLCRDVWPKSTKVFLSSGTGGSRSASPFSPKGLANYKASSLKSLRLMGLDHTASVYSLIPTTEEWPDSSLAQMVAWLAEVSHVQWISMDDLASLKFLPGNKWLLGTGFHLIQAVEKGLSIALPPDFQIFETGGLKGHKREYTTEEYFDALSQGWEVDRHQIRSEYGMAELGSIATSTSHNPATNRPIYRFSDGVELSVFGETGHFKKAGEGLLTISDSTRIDLPYPLRTQDWVQLKGDQSFEILGRLPKASPKGCSLIAAETEAPAVEEAPEEAYQLTCETRKNSLSPHELFTNFLNSKQVYQALSNELNSESMAQHCLDDFRVHSKKTVDDWKAAVRASKAQEQSGWLVLPPGNHPVATWAPLVLASLAGCHLTVRLPHTLGIESSLGLLLKELSAVTSIKVLSANWRVGTHAFPKKAKGILVCGSDETIDSICRAAPVPVAGHGSALTLSVLTQRDQPDTLVRDIVALNQRGCLSSQGGLFLGEQAAAALLARSLQRLSREFAYTDPKLQVAKQLEAERFRYMGYKVEPGPLMTPINTWKQGDPLPEKDWTSDFSGVFPILCFEDPNELKEVIGSWPNLRNLSISPYLEIECPDKISRRCALGDSNSPSIDGLHLGKPWFSTL